MLLILLSALNVAGFLDLRQLGIASELKSTLQIGVGGDLLF